jgi:hypothetical protein
MVAREENRGIHRFVEAGPWERREVFGNRRS